MQMNIRKNDILWSYLNYGMNTVTNMVVLLFAITFLPSNELGMWYTFLSLGAIVQLIDFGFSPCILRNISFAWSGAVELKKSGIPKMGKREEVNYQLLHLIICGSRYVYTAMAVTVLFLGTTLGSFYICAISDEVNQSVYMVAWIIYIISLIINIYFGYWASCLQGIGAVKENNQAKVVSYIVLAIVTILGLFFSCGLLSMSMGNLFSGIIYRMLAKKYFSNKEGINENNILSSKMVKKTEVFELLKVIWSNTWKMGINSLGTYFITQGNTLLCSAFLGLEVTATYGLSLQICNAVVTVAKILLSAYQPKLVELNLNGDKKTIIKLFSTIIVTYWIIIIVSGIGLIILGIPLISIIKSDTSLPYSVMIYMLLYMSLEGNHSCFATYLTTQNKIPFFRAGLISAIGVFAVSFIFVKWTRWGIWALMLGQSLVQLIYNNWKWPYIVLKEFSISFIEMLRIGFFELLRKLKNEIKIWKRKWIY